MTTHAVPSAQPIHLTEEQPKCELLHSHLYSWMHPRLDFGTTDHFGVRDPLRVNADSGYTTLVMVYVPSFESYAAEVKELRDHIAHNVGLSRQDIARAIGVDRRSLSGYVTGEIRPTKPRMDALRALAATATWSEAEFGERAREVFRSSDDDSTLLDRIAGGRTDTRWELREAAARIGLESRPNVTTRTRATRPPLYLNAAAKWRNESRLPGRRGTPRSTSVYEQDLSQAPKVVVPPERPRRRGI